MTIFIPLLIALYSYLFRIKLPFKVALSKDAHIEAQNPKQLQTDIIAS